MALEAFINHRRSQTMAGEALRRMAGELLPIAALLLVGGFFLLWRIDQLPPNIVDEPLGGAITAWILIFKKDVIAATLKAIEESRRTGLIDLPFLRQNSLDWFTAWGYLSIYPLSVPLSVVVPAVSFAVFGASLAVFAGTNAAMALLAVFVLYLLGLRMYGRGVGLLAALLLTTSFYFINYIRGPLVIFNKSLLVLLTVLFMYFLYLAVETKRVRYRWLLGIVGGLIIFNGWMVALMLPGIALVFLLTNGNWRSAWQGVPGKGASVARRALRLSRLVAKGLGGYAMVAAIAVAFGVLLTVLWSLFLGLEPLASLRGLYEFSIQYRGSSTSLASPGARLENALKFWDTVFASNLIMEPVLKGLLALGIIVCLWKRSSADRLALSWLLGGLATFAFAVTFLHPKYFLIMFPVVCLVAARPLEAAWQLAAKTRPLRWSGIRTAPLPLFTAVVTLSLIWNGIRTYDRYFVTQESLGFSADYSQIARFLETASPTQPAAVVYPDYIADMPFEVSFHFANKPRPFRFFAWNSDEKVGTQVWASFNTLKPDGIAAWERLILTRYPKLFYIVPRDEPWYQQSFAKLHPGLAPLKTVEPVIRLDIYQVTAPSALVSSGPTDDRLIVENPDGSSVLSFQKGNLLRNASFEDWASGIPQDWRLFSVSGLSASLSRSDDSNGGGSAITIKPSALSQSLYQDFTAENGVSYFTGKNLTFGVWAKSKEPTGKLYLQFRVNNSGTMSYRIFDITSSYEFYTITLENAPAGEKGYRVEIMPGDDSHFNEITIADAVLLEGPYCWDGYCSEQDVRHAIKGGSYDQPSAGESLTETQPQAKENIAEEAAPEPVVLTTEGYQKGLPEMPASLKGRTNLLPDSSFEAWGKDSTVATWEPFYATTEPIRVSKSTDSKSGQYAVLLKPTDLSQAIYQDFTGQQGVDYFVGKKVTFGVWAKSVAPTGVMRLHIRRDNNFTEEIEYFMLTDKYQFFSITSDKLAPATSEGYRVEIIPGNEQGYCDIIVDDAVVVERE